MKTSATIVGLVLLALIAAGSLWNASESHYRACIETRFANDIAAVPAGTFVEPGKEPAAQLSTVSTVGCKRWPL